MDEEFEEVVITVRDDGQEPEIGSRRRIVDSRGEWWGTVLRFSRAPDGGPLAIVLRPIDAR